MGSRHSDTNAAGRTEPTGVEVIFAGGDRTAARRTMPTAVKIIIIGGLGVGKTTLIGAVSDPAG
jgi:GTPase SAR1 family protein